MADLCSIMITGRLTSDSEIKYTTKTPILKFSVAVGRYEKGKTETSFFDVVQFGRAVDALSSRLTKGKPVVVRGEMRQEFWTTQEGAKRSKWVLLADSYGVQPLGGQEGHQNLLSKYDDDVEIPF